MTACTQISRLKNIPLYSHPQMQKNCWFYLVLLLDDAAFTAYLMTCVFLEVVQQLPVRGPFDESKSKLEKWKCQLHH